MINKILIPSDDTKLELESFDKLKDVFFYRYTKAKENKDLVIPISEKELLKNIKNGVFKEI